MKKLAQSLLLFVFLSSSVSFAKNAETYLAKLKSYSAKDIVVSAKQNEDFAIQKTQDMLETIQESVDFMMDNKDKMKLEFAIELARVSAMSFKHDPSESATEMLEPLYKKHKSLFEAAFKTLPARDVRDLRDSLKNTAREDAEGNG